MKQALSPTQRLRSIGFALQGIVSLVKTQPNAQLHCLAAAVVVVAACLTNVSSGEWLALLIVIGMVWSSEALNSAIEVLCDKVEPEIDPAIKVAKDMAAAGVLLAAITAAVVGAVIFIPYWF